ncbi:MAG: WD40 repeat domain-containing protein [Alphaproteobacteria bacterium]
MTMTPPPSAIAQQWTLPAPINALATNTPDTHGAASLGDGTIAIFTLDDTPPDPQICPVHDGVSLSLVACGADFISGGDDGRVVRITSAADPQILVQHKGRWIDHVAALPDGSLIAAAAGKNLHLMDGGGQALGTPHLHVSSIGGLAFSPNGKRIAASHNNGLSLWWTKAQEQKPVILPWKGSHLATIWHPDGKTVLTAMQENALHGWRLADMNEMRMQGYAGKIHALRWTPKGKWLVTSGAAQAVCWPFFGGGPWGKAPQGLGLDRGVLVSTVAPHPHDDLVAIGYADGMIELAPLDGRPGIMAHPPIDEQDHAVTGLLWNQAGDNLFAASGTYLMRFTPDSLAAAVRQ